MHDVHCPVVAPVAVLVLAGLFAPPDAAFSQSDDGCALRGNRILKQPVCIPLSDNPFCVLGDLAPVQSTDRVIWDGSFQSPNSDCLGPGGRWVGDTEQRRWDSLTRYVENRGGDGELVLVGGIDDQIRARVYGQSFGAAAARFENEFGNALSTDVVVPRTGFICLSFTASISEGPDGCLPAWVQVRLGSGAPGETPELVDVEGAGMDDRWSIQSGSQVRCILNLPLPEDSAECPDPMINLRFWHTMVQFAVDKHSSGRSALRIDDIDVRLVTMEEAAENPTNLLYREPSQSCGLHLLDTPSWTLITDGHWSGGGLDGTTPIIPSEGPCLGDIDGTGVVDVSDLLIVINNWGSTDPCSPGDLDGNGATDVSDLQVVLSAWGPCG